LKLETRNPEPATELETHCALQVSLRHEFATGFFLHLDFSIPPGITMLFGPSGAGKSTVLDCIAGLLRPQEGHIAMAGRALFDSRKGIDVPVSRRGIGYVFQTLALFPHLNVEANLQYGMHGIPASERRRRMDAMLEAFRIGHLRKQLPRNLSGGERQRVALARSLVTNPCALLLDEPLTALDALTKSRIIADLRAWNDARRIPVLYVTHDRQELFALGERVLAIAEGRLVAAGTPQELLRAPRHEVLAQLAGFENIFDVSIVARDESRGTMTCRIEPGILLEVPLSTESAGDFVRLGIHAGDILLADRKPEGLSARNLLPGRISRLERRDVTMVAEVNCGVPFLAHLTPGAQESLHLEPGAEVWLIVKTYSCHLLRPA
jgi:molybdate transport system ATP-binding protein